MAEDQKGKARPIGQTGDTVRKNIRKIRDGKGISAPELSATLDRLGRPIPPLGINRIESGTRRVDVDDLACFAVALGVSPSSLMMPLWNDDGSEVAAQDLVPITGWHARISASVVWGWITAARPLVRGTVWAFVRHGLPSWERERAEAEMEAAIQGRDREIYGEASHGDD